MTTRPKLLAGNSSDSPGEKRDPRLSGGGTEEVAFLTRTVVRAVRIRVDWCIAPPLNCDRTRSIWNCAVRSQRHK